MLSQQKSSTAVNLAWNQNFKIPRLTFIFLKNTSEWLPSWSLSNCKSSKKNYCIAAENERTEKREKKKSVTLQWLRATEISIHFCRLHFCSEYFNNSLFSHKVNKCRLCDVGGVKLWCHSWDMTFRLKWEMFRVSKAVSWKIHISEFILYKK